MTDILSLLSIGIPPLAFLAVMVLQLISLIVISRGQRRPRRQPRQIYINTPPEEEVAATNVAPPFYPQQQQQPFDLRAWKHEMRRRFPQ